MDKDNLFSAPVIGEAFILLRSIMTAIEKTAAYLPAQPASQEINLLSTYRATGREIYSFLENAQPGIFQNPRFCGPGVDEHIRKTLEI